MKIFHICALLCFSFTLCNLSSAEKYEWQKPHAEVLPGGDLKWAPLPFTVNNGSDPRYIDYENGKDSNDGKSTKSAWKHHPWDSQATGKAKAAKGIRSYIFKRGVTYRGSLVAKENGTAGNPIRLCSDPAWGTGEAMLSGAELVTGWQKGKAHKKIPNADKVWSVNLDYAPRAIYMVDKKGTVTNIPLARTPNWTVTNPEDVMSNWWVMEQPQWWKRENHKTTVNGKKMHKLTDRKNLTKKPDYYKGAYVYSEYGIIMGTPFASNVEAVVDGGLAFQGIWTGATEGTMTG